MKKKTNTSRFSFSISLLFSSIPRGDFSLLSTAICLLVCFVFSSSSAQWQMNGVPVCDTSANGGIEPLSKIASDGAGGAFICWRDIRSGNYDIYAQHLDSTGTVTWQRNGIAVVNDPAAQDFPRITADGIGGAIVAWEDSRSVTNTHAYAQRINKDGNPLWQANGIRVADRSGLFISIAGDGFGGLLSGWVTGGIYDVVVQCLDSLGNRMWGDSGVVVTNRSGNVSSNDVAIVTDGSGGAIVAWSEAGRVYTQRVDSAGTVQWQENGVLLSDSSVSSSVVAVSSDKKGGAFVSWGSGTIARVQRVDSNGQTLWQPWGVTMPAMTGSGGVRRNISDGHGGGFVGHRQAINHFDSLGTKLWGDTGAVFTTNPSVTNSVHVRDAGEGVFNFTEWFKNGEGAFIVAQWIDQNGSVRFGPEGKRVTPWLSIGDQNWPSATSDGRGGAIVCWSDYRSQYPVIYAARVDTSGIVESVPDEGSLLPLTLVLEQNYPNPFNPETTIRFQLAKRGKVRLELSDILGRTIATLVDETKDQGTFEIPFDGTSLPSGVYFYKLIAEGFSQTRKMLLIR